jgi:mRNA interferase MazF
MSEQYIPKQGDLVWANFDPSRGKEIKKRRPALVISNNDYQIATGLAIVLPITTSIKTWSSRYTLTDYAIEGQINTNQSYSFDFKNRQFEFIEQIKPIDFYQVAQMYLQNFTFGI